MALWWANRWEACVVVETRYVAGSGVLVGSGDHWLLVTDPGDEAVVDRLWAVLGSGSGPLPADEVLAIVDDAFDDVPGLVLVDLTPATGQTVSRGTGRVQVEGPARVLSLGDAADGPTRRLVAGVVGASRAVVRPLAPKVAPSPVAGVSSPAPAAGALIDGIPQEILDARGPDGPPPPRPAPSRPQRHDRGDSGPVDSVPRDTSEPDPELMSRVSDARPPVIAIPTAGPDADADQGASGVAGEVTGQDDATEMPAGDGTEDPSRAGTADHDGSTVFRPDHLVAAASGETVPAVWCPAGHLTDPTIPLCRVCRAQVAPQHPQRVPRPALGGLRLPSGEVVPLDRGVVLGRRPQPLPSSGDWPHLVTLPAEHTFVSRMHLHLSLEGWQVVARDLGSRGGTTVRPPGRVPERMVAEQPYVLEPGTALDLADTYEVRFEVGPEVGPEPPAPSVPGPGQEVVG